MRFRTEWVIAALALAAGACRVERGTPPQGRTANVQPGGTSAGFQSWPDTAPPSGRQIFDRERQSAQGAARLLVHAIIQVDQGRAAARSALQQLADSLRQRDTTLAAVRVIGYFPPSAPDTSGGGAALLPMGYLEWVPIQGWDSVSTATAKGMHRVNIVWLRPVPEAPTRTSP